MKAHVVYESMYGNTHRIAEAIASGLEDLGEVAVGPIANTTPDTLAAVDLLVVGGPTHMHGMSNAASRRAAIETAEKSDAIDAGSRRQPRRTADLVQGAAEGEGAIRRRVRHPDRRPDRPHRIGGQGHHQTAATPPLRAAGRADELPRRGLGGTAGDGEFERARRWGNDLADLMIARGQPTA